jgi:Fe-S cluster biogenesis protein NfuA/nitrite reductase/ring-hydroxylating ferredoxin subunit
MDDAQARERVARIETLLEDVERLGDPAARDTAMELVETLLDVYGEGLARVVALLDGDGEVARALTADELVSHLLLLHGLHPVALEARVRGALAEVRPYLESHGGDVQLVGVEDGVVRLRLEGSCSGCPSSTMTLKLAIEDAIHKAAPDVERIDADGVDEPAPGPGLLQLEISDAVRERADAGADTAAWAPAGKIAEVAGDGPRVAQVAGEPVLFVSLGRSVYAYRPQCPGCGRSLGDAAQHDEELTCAGCGARYDARHAGRSRDAEDLHLEPVPLLVDAAGVVKVALGAPA